MSSADLVQKSFLKFLKWINGFFGIDHDQKRLERSRYNQLALLFRLQPDDSLLFDLNYRFNVLNHLKNSYFPRSWSIVHANKARSLYRNALFASLNFRLAAVIAFWAQRTTRLFRSICCGFQWILFHWTVTEATEDECTAFPTVDVKHLRQKELMWFITTDGQFGHHQTRPNQTRISLRCFRARRLGTEGYLFSDFSKLNEAILNSTRSFEAVCCDLVQRVFPEQTWSQ